MSIVANILGDLSAENDFPMLQHAFLETTDYRTLLESSDKIIVVGRRGTGKSALTFKLEDDWKKHSKTNVFKLAPDEDQVIGIRSILARFEEKYELIRAALKIGWEATIYLEILRSLSHHYKFDKTENSIDIKRELNVHHHQNRNIAYNLRSVLKRGLASSDAPEEAIADFAEKIELTKLRLWVKSALLQTDKKIKILIDCLDEGYSPDVIGIAYIAGIIQATLNINSMHDAIRPVLFIRDNMFRAVAQYDPDYTRNIEGYALRLHWGEPQLLNLAAKRLKFAFSFDQENDIRVWNNFTANGVQSREGFRKCLRLTLYRPRDLIALLNQAFYAASREDRLTIIDKDIEETAKEISQVRLHDLVKEYQVIFPSISNVISLFLGFHAEFPAKNINQKLLELISSYETEKVIQQELAFFDDGYELLKALYSIGFIGIKDPASGTYLFCHDGRDPNISINAETILFVHPCYQVALNLNTLGFTEEVASDIFDDYEIEVSSVTQEQRNKKIGQLISKIRDINSGSEDCSEFENWCFDAIKTIFAGSLSNIQQHPNKTSPQRRDIAATISSETELWKRILNDYKARHILFEVKNYTDLKPNDFRQLASYLSDTYGNIGFLIYRDENKEPNKDRDLIWIREIYWKSTPKKLIVLLSYKHLINFLEKIRNPQKYNAVEKVLLSIVDNYHHRYLNESVGKKR